MSGPAGRTSPARSPNRSGARWPFRMQRASGLGKRRPTEAAMIKTALDQIAPPASAKLLGWQLLAAKPEEGWLKVGFDGKKEFCNPAGFVQGGLLTAMLDDTMGPAAFIMTDGKFYTTTIS